MASWAYSLRWLLQGSPYTAPYRGFVNVPPLHPQKMKGRATALRAESATLGIVRGQGTPRPLPNTPTKTSRGPTTPSTPPKLRDPSAHNHMDILPHIPNQIEKTRLENSCLILEFPKIRGRSLIRPQNRRALIVRTPTKRTNNLWKQPYPEKLYYTSGTWSPAVLLRATSPAPLQRLQEKRFDKWLLL